MTVRPTFTGPAAVPANLSATLSPATTAQSAPGGQVLTASATGGTGAVSWAWVATYSDGSSADGLLSGSGASRTLTTTAYRQVVAVTATATDSGGANVQSASASAVVSVGAAPALVSGGDLAATQLSAGTTSQAFTFAAPTGGVAPITNTLTIASLTGAPTLSTYSGRTATINGMTDEEVVQVTLTSTDALGQVVTATGVWGVDVVASYTPPTPETVVDEIDFRTIGSASASGGATTVVGGRSLLTTVVSSATGTTLTVDGNGATIASTDPTVGRGYALTVSMPLAVTSFGKTEDLILDVVFSVGAGGMTSSSAINVGVGTSTHYSNGTTYHIHLLGGASTDTINLRRYVGSASTHTLASGQTTDGKTYACQIVVSGGNVGYGGISESSSYLATPRPEKSPAASGTWAGTIGGSAVSIGAAEARLFSPFNLLIGIASGAISVTIIKARVLRRARA